MTDHQDVLDAAERIGVKNVVHFTTTTGALGVLAAEAVKSRERLPEDKYLEHVYKPNTAFRKDTEWLDYVNLSIERVNDWMFEKSKRWHPTENDSWVVLSFSPNILAHPGVVFTTTNNIYPACMRAEGLEGFNKMFDETVRGRYDELHNRRGNRSSWPTDRQAEVLYPGELSCEHLQRIDVQVEEVVETICGMFSALELPCIPVCHAPEVFE